MRALFEKTLEAASEESGVGAKEGAEHTFQMYSKVLAAAINALSCWAYDFNDKVS